MNASVSIRPWQWALGEEFAVPGEIDSAVDAGLLADDTTPNDECPVFVAGDCWIWVEHPEPARRRLPSAPRLRLSRVNDDGTEQELLACDDAGELLAELKRAQG